MKDLGRQVYLGGEHMRRVTVAFCSFPQDPGYACSCPVTGAGPWQAC